MAGKPYQTYNIPNSRLVKNTSLFDALVHDLKNNQKIKAAAVYDTKNLSTSNNWLKRLKTFCKSKLQPCKQTLNGDDTLATLSSTNNNMLDSTQFGSCFMLDQSILLPLTAIDAEAIYQDISLSRTSSLHHSQVLPRHTLYDDLQSNQIGTHYTSNYSLQTLQRDSSIKRLDIGPTEQGTVYHHQGDSLKKKRQGIGHYQQQNHPDIQEVQYISPTVHDASFYPHYIRNHRYSADKLSLSAGTTATSSLSPSSSLGVYQCNNTNYLHKREPDDTYSTFNSLYSTFATSTSNNNMCTDTALSSSSSPPSIPFNSPQDIQTTTQEASETLMADSMDISTCIPKDENLPLVTTAALSSPTMADLSFAKFLAKDFWDGKQTVCEYEMIAAWLGTNDPFRASVLQHYMDYFEFTNQPLDEAFRNLCAKLFFKAESQQMDRIIEVFAKRYWECNPTDLYHSADVVYAMAYSLLLLNTDLHGVQEHHQKMKKARFVKNTMETISALVFPLQGSVSPNMDGTKVKKTEGIKNKEDGNPISTPARPPSIDTSTLSRKNSLGVRRQIRKTKSHHSLAMSPFALKRSSFWRGNGGGSLLQQQRTSHDNDDNINGGDDEEDEEIDKNTVISGDSNTFTTLCKAMKETTTKSQSLIDLPYYLKQRYAGIDGDRYQTRDERRWLANIEQLLKDMYTSIKSREIVRLASPPVDLDSCTQEQGRLSLDRRATDLKNKQRLIRRKRGRSAPPPPTESTTPSEYWVSQDSNDIVDDDSEDDDTTRELYRNASSWSCQDLQKQACHQKPPPKKLKTFLTEDSTTTHQEDYGNPNLSLSGWVMRKCLMQGTRRKAKQRNWKKCHLKIQQGKLVMQCSGRRMLSGQPWINPIKYYRHGSTATQWRRSISVLQYGYGDDYDEESEYDDDDGDDDDIHIDDGKNHVTLEKEESIDLNHSLSRILPPPGWHGQRNHVVCLQMTDGASWLFQVHTHQKAQTWTEALNYWAALHSKEPLPGGVTNIDYGWSNSSATSDSKDDGNDNEEDDDEPHSTQTLPSWEAPASCLISSQLSKKDQLDAINRYIDRLTSQADHHRNLRKLVEKRYPPRKPNGVQAMTNWEFKMQYLLFEKIKFQTYHDSLASHIL